LMTARTMTRFVPQAMAQSTARARVPPDRLCAETSVFWLVRGGRDLEIADFAGPDFAGPDFAGMASP
jgi:hypothetical protein